MIQAFADKDTEKLFNGRRVKKYSSELSERALQKLLMLNAANQISDLRMPPGNRLEALVGDRKGQHRFTPAGSSPINSSPTLVFHRASSLI